MNDYYDYYTYSSPPTFNPLPTIISLVLCVFVLVCMWIVFRKAGKPGWAAIVPFYNLYVLFDITWGSGMRFLLLLIPIYNIILGIQTQVRLARAFGKSGGFAAGLVFMPYIFIPLLAFGKETYQGVPVSRAAIPSSPSSPIKIPIPSSPSRDPMAPRLSRATSSHSITCPNRATSSPSSLSMLRLPSSPSSMRPLSSLFLSSPSSIRHPSSLPLSSLPLSSLPLSSRSRPLPLPLFAPAAA